VGPDNLYHRWKGIAEFVAGEDLDRQGYQPTAFTVFSPQKSDLSFSPGNNAWGVKAGANKFILSPDGSISPPESNLTTFLYSNSKAQFRNPPVFHVELSKPGPFKVLLGDLSKVEPNKLTILLDGKPTSVNKTIAKAHSAYGVDVPAGAHDISVDSTGADWVQVASYSIGGYAGALRCKALNGKNKVLGRVQSRSFTYGSKERPEVKGAVLHLSGLKQDGSWKVEWWDAEKGVKTGTTQINVKKGNADLPLPAITKDLAFKAIATVNVP
jgi:hypothetical protein